MMTKYLGGLLLIVGLSLPQPLSASSGGGAIQRTPDEPTSISHGMDDATPERVQFNRDVRPILSDRCYLCHGPDQTSELAQESSLRLDNEQSTRQHGVFDFESIEASEFLLRIMSDEDSFQMPPADSGKNRLAKSEIDILRRWIQQGAHYERHWSYVPAVRPILPDAEHSDWISNPIDAFVLNRLKSNRMLPSPKANREVLLRRVSFDLTGLPPTISEIDEFLADSGDDDSALAKVINRLLESPQFGEHMARHWLDAARYADTGGYQYDRERTQWVWRDWVINAINTNMPFDQFTIEQIAGDMLPQASDQTRLATGFNRNHPITIEGGVVDEEYRNEYVIDRVVTTSTVWLGQTFLCARCHDHKYDPISQEDFYQFYSFFNNVPEKGLNGFEPRISVASPLARPEIAQLKNRLSKAQEAIDHLKHPIKKSEEKLRQMQPDWTTSIAESIRSTEGATVEIQSDKSILIGGENPETDDYVVEFSPRTKAVNAIRLEVLCDASFVNNSASRSFNGNFVLTEFEISVAQGEGGQWKQIGIQSASADYEQAGYGVSHSIDNKIQRKGWAVDGNIRPENRTAIFHLKNPIAAGNRIQIKLLQRFGRSHQIGRFRLAFSAKQSLPSRLSELFLISAETRTHKETEEYSRLLVARFGSQEAKNTVERYEVANRQLSDAMTFPTTMVMKEMAKPRTAFVLERGEYDRPIRDRTVTAGVPKAIGASANHAISDRLGLARWLVSDRQPLTARVTVNRYWQQLFGVGLVKTSEDFGSQGEFPSHPELLDWLAVEFMESGWDVKGIFRTILMSNTYRQSSKMSLKSINRDPENRMLGRGPRLRLDGETIRDSALAVSGLLDLKVGGPSVYPYHPKGLWLEINNRPNYSRAYPHSTDRGQLYRRSMYTFWKRTVTPPSSALFDAPSREYCVVRRSRTNTPLQALVMLHDPQFIEAARQLAVRMMDEGGTTSRSKIQFGFRLCTSRRPTEAETDVLMEAFREQMAKYESDIQSARKLLDIGEKPIDMSRDMAEWAAYAQVARMLINLSEFLTKG